MVSPLELPPTGLLRLARSETVFCPTCRHPTPAGARFCPQCGTRLQRDADHSPRFAPRAQAERRQVTVMFCDLVESTALAFRLDAEDLLEVTRSYQSCVSATVQRFGG